MKLALLEFFLVELNESGDEKLKNKKTPTTKQNV